MTRSWHKPGSIYAFRALSPCLPIYLPLRGLQTSLELSCIIIGLRSYSGFIFKVIEPKPGVLAASVRDLYAQVFCGNGITPTVAWRKRYGRNEYL